MTTNGSNQMVASIWSSGCAKEGIYVLNVGGVGIVHIISKYPTGSMLTFSKPPDQALGKSYTVP